MRWPLAAAVLGGALLVLPGCDEKDSQTKKADVPIVAATDARTASAPAAEPAVVTAPAGAASTLSSAAPGPAPVADEGLASRAGSLFDGSRSNGSVKPVAAGSSHEDWRVGPKAQPNALVRTVSLDKRGVPAPDALPKVTLPDPESPDQASAGVRGAAKGSVLLALESFEKKFFDTVTPLFSRAAWGAAPARSKSTSQTPTRVTVHHTDTKQTFDEKETMAVVRSIQAFHMGSDAKHGWNDIGYHFLIDGAGRVLEGRHPDVLGAHAQGANTNNIGIALLGDYNRDKPTPAQVESLRRLVSFLALKYRADPRQKGFLQPHQHYDDTDCPGKNVMAILETLRQQIDSDTLDLITLLAPGKTTTQTARFTPLLVTRPANA